MLCVEMQSTCALNSSLSLPYMGDWNASRSWEENRSVNLIMSLHEDAVL